MRLFVGGANSTICGERAILSGDRCFSVYYSPSRDGSYLSDPRALTAIGDSGAFQNVKEGTRLTFEQALERQFGYEAYLHRRSPEWIDWRFHAITTYDLLIDEKWIDGRKVKRRWSEEEAWVAVEETISAAQFFDQNRGAIVPRIPIMACQGVTAAQYALCLQEVLKVCKAGDWIGLGGWCILGMFPKWLDVYNKMLLDCIPLIAASPVRHIHLFGVLWTPALGPLQWMCDRHGLTCSTDSQKPLLQCRPRTAEKRKKAGAREHYWKDNVRWWIEHCQNLGDSVHYRSPTSQLSLFSN